MKKPPGDNQVAIKQFRIRDVTDADSASGWVDWSVLSPRLGGVSVEMDIRLASRQRSHLDMDMVSLGGVDVLWYAVAGVSMVRTLRHVNGASPDITLTIPFSGCCEAVQDGVRSDARSGQAVMLRASRANSVEVTERGEFIGVRVSREVLSQACCDWLDATANQRGPMQISTDTASFKLLRSYLFGLRTIQGSIDAAEVQLARRHIIDLVEGSLLWRNDRLQAPLQPLDYTAIRQAARALMERHHADATISSEDVAGWMNLPTETVEASFVEDRTSFDSELLKIRLGHVGRSLRDPDGEARGVAELALNHGLDDSATLMQAFEAIYGTDPETYRRTRIG